ncbi:MAG TPA: hypothetical protein VGI67_13770, partial [Thermoleophilaceae bacterium]
VTLQRDVSRADAARAAASHGIRSWVYVGEDSGWRVRAERGELADLDVEPLGELVERYSWELRAPYIDWIGELSLANESLDWWASELAAKNPFMLLYNRICALAAARSLIADGLTSALVVCSSSALASGVLDFARENGVEASAIAPGEEPASGRREGAAARLVDVLARHAPPSALARLPGPARRGLDAAPSYRRRLLERLGARGDIRFGGQGSALLFTWVDARSLAPDGSYRDPHFGSLPRLLRDAGQRVAYVPHFLPGAEVEPVARRLLHTDETMIFPELFLDDAALGDCRARAERFAPTIPDHAELGRVPVTALAREQIESLRWMHAIVLSYATVVRGLVLAGVRPERVFFPYEGHSWEQVVCWAFRNHAPGTKLVGYDNVNFSRLALSMYPAASEYGHRPLPDHVVTNGETFRRVLEEEGFPHESIRVGCALRHEYLSSEQRKPPPAHAGGGATRVLVATSIDSGQSVELIELALAAFAGVDGHRVVVKLHPAVDRPTVLALLGPAARAPNVEFDDAPMPEQLERADVLLYKYTVVCYEALAHGVPCVFVKSETGLDLDQLEPFPDLRRSARTPAELRAAVSELTSMAGDERADWERRALEAVRASLAPVNDGCAWAFLS